MCVCMHVHIIKNLFAHCAQVALRYNASHELAIKTFLIMTYQKNAYIFKTYNRSIGGI